MAFFDMFRRGTNQASNSDMIVEDLQKIKEQTNLSQINEIPIDEDNSDRSMIFGDIQSITESTVSQHSPESLSKLLDSDDIKTQQVLTELKADYSPDELYQENEEMSRDSVVGSAMEIVADDVCQVDEKSGLIVTVESDDEKLAKFLQDFLEHNVNVEDRVWEWALEVIKHGDFKLRRREYYTGPKESGIKNVYYENVLQPYKVTRIEYMGRVLGYRDEEFDESKVSFEKPDSFVHFMSSKLSKREKVKLKVRNDDNSMEEVTCYKVRGSSIMDNARYIFRIVNLLDNMLIMSRVARSTQYNIVKVEVGNASGAKTQQILSDVRRRIEGSTKMKKNVGMKTDPSPIPVNSNVYIPVRDGKGDITVESVNENVDVRSIVDIDYFRDKEFATLKIPKQYAGFEECFRYNTKVRLSDGKDYEIGYLADHPDVWKNLEIMTCSIYGEESLSKIVHVKKTRINAEFVRVTLSNNLTIDVTPDHKMMTYLGDFIEAKDLVRGMILMYHECEDAYPIDYIVSSVEYIDDIEDAYDLGVESDNHTFLLSCGIYVHNSMPGTLGNSSLAKLDIRYARSVQRVQTIIRYGIEELCNNYLRYRGRPNDVGKFNIRMRPVSTSETASRVEEYITNMQAFDSVANTLETFGDYIDKAKLFKSTLGLIGMQPSDIASEEFMTILKEMEDGTYVQSNHVKQESEQEEGEEKW